MIHVVNLCNSLAEWKHAMIVSHYINIILILISCPILSLNLVTQMWKIIMKYPGIFSTRFAVPTTKLRRTGEILSFQIALAAARAMMKQEYINLAYVYWENLSQIFSSEKRKKLGNSEWFLTKNTLINMSKNTSKWILCLLFCHSLHQTALSWVSIFQILITSAEWQRLCFHLCTFLC